MEIIMNVKKSAVIFVFLACFVFGINAQETKQNICSQIKETNFLVSDKQVVVIGEVFDPQILKATKFPITVTQSIATVGGLTKEANVKEVQIIKCSSSLRSADIVTFVNLQKIRNKEKMDLELKGGEIIYIPKMKKSIVDFKLLISNSNDLPH